MNTKRKALVVMVTVFFLGLVAGMAIDRYALDKYSRHQRHHRKPPDFKQMFTKELDLNQEQQEKLDVLLSELKEKIDKVRHSNYQQYGKIRNEFNENFRVILDTGQKQKFEQMIKEFEEKKKKRDWK